MIDSVRQQINESARAIPDSNNTWRVVVSSKSLEDANTVSARLEDAGFEVLSLREAGADQAKVAAPAKRPISPASAVSIASANKLRLTARAIAPGREVIAFAGGAAALVHSSAPLVFASSDEANAPVRFNDKPFRGKIEVFANTRGALTVVNVIGLEDYVRGVVPNELSPGGYPAIEALKAQQSRRAPMRSEPGTVRCRWLRPAADDPFTGLSWSLERAPSVIRAVEKPAA